MKSNKRLFYSKSALAVLSFLVLGGCSCSLKPGSQEINPNQAETSQPANDAITKPGLLGMLMGKNGVKCQVEDKTGKYEVIAKEGKVKINGINFQPTPAVPIPPTSDSAQMKPKTGTMISDSKILYMWSGTEGIKMNIEDAQANQPQTGGSASPNQNWSEWAKQMEESGAKYECDNANVSDSEFNPPEGVKFQDLSQMMQNLPKAVTPESLPNKPPTDLPFNAQPQ